jgi:putative transposase
MTLEKKKSFIDKGSKELPVSRQCELLDLCRSSLYYEPKVSLEDLAFRVCIDSLYTKNPIYGSRRLAFLAEESLGFPVNRKRVQLAMRDMGIAGIAPGPQTSRPSPDHKIYPYLLRGVKALRPCHIWSTDITYIRLAKGYAYLVAVLDWYSRYVLSWQLSNTMEVNFCVEALVKALEIGQPMIFNTDQGSQFTSKAFTGILLERGIQVSMDGRGRALDNVFVERLWRSVKYEDVYINDYESLFEAHLGLTKYFHFYNNKRPHSQGCLIKPPPELAPQIGILHSWRPLSSLRGC